MTQWKGMPRPWLLGIIASILLHAGGVVFIAQQSLSDQRDIDGPRPLTGILYVQPRPSLPSPSPLPPANAKPAATRPRLAPPPANHAADAAAQSSSAAALASRPQKSDGMVADNHDLPPAPTGGQDSGLVLSLPANASKARGLHPNSNTPDPADRKLTLSRPKDVLAEGIREAAIPDCLSENQAGGLLALPGILYRAASGKCK